MYCFCIGVVESFICYILTSGVNVNLCVNYKIFVFHRSIFTEKLPLKNWHSIVCGILCRLRLGSLDQVIQLIIVQLRKSCFFSLLSFWFQILNQGPNWNLGNLRSFLNFSFKSKRDLTAENVSLKVFKFAAKRKNLYVTQPCLHTLMQTRLSANQSARTVLVIL